MTERARCYYCNRFISFETALKSWKHIQTPGVIDPEPYEIMWCDGCGDNERRSAPAGSSEQRAEGGQG